MDPAASACPEPARHAPTVDLLLLVVLSTLWGASYTFIRVAVATIPPITAIAAQTLIAGALLVAWIVARGIAVPREPAFWRRVFVQALLNSVLPFTLIAWAEQTVPAGLATILNATSPALTLLGSWCLGGREPATRGKVFGIAAGLTGVCLIVGSSALAGLGTQLWPQLAIVAATVCYAGAAIYGRSFRGLSPALPAAGSMLVGAALLLPLSLMLDRPWTLRPSHASVAALAALAVLSTALAFVIYFRLIQTVGSVATTAQSFLRVPIGVALGVAVLGESLTPTAWIGLVSVVAGVAAMTVPRRGH